MSRWALTLFALAILAAPTLAQKKESVYDRVIRTGVVRAGYAMNPPVFMKDPNTGKCSGIMYDITNKAFASLGLKVEWTEELGWGQMTEALVSNRVDIIACGLWSSPQRARVIDYSIFLFYSPLGIWVRTNDHRFDRDFSKINDPAVTIAVLDGEMSSIIAQYDFPKAKTLALPQLSDITTNLLNVRDKKADVTFIDPIFAFDFLKHNPGTIRNVCDKQPFRYFGNGIGMKRGEVEFKNMLNLVLDEMLRFGTVEEIIKKYEPFPGAYMRVAKPYATP